MKAVYVWYNDPDNEVKLQFVTFFIDDWTGTGYFYGIRVFQAPEIVSQGYELLDYFGCSMNPTIDETHRVRFDVTFDNLGLLDWDELLHVRIIVLAPSGTNINAVLS